MRNRCRLTLARGRFRLAKFAMAELVGILLCMVFARSAAMAFNRLADRRLDAANPRTAGRHMPAGILSVRQVTRVCRGVQRGVRRQHAAVPAEPAAAVSCRAGAGVSCCGYSYAKRFTALAHFWLGAALALSPVAAWIAIRGEAVLQSTASTCCRRWCWAAPCWRGSRVSTSSTPARMSTSTAQAGLHSVPVRLGVAGALRLAAACHLATIVLAGRACRWSIRRWAGSGGRRRGRGGAAGLRAFPGAARRPGPREHGVF